MRKYIFFIIHCFAITTLSAQPESGTVSIIPHIGATFSNISKEVITTLESFNPTEYKGKTKVGVMIGADLQYQLNTALALSIGANYQQMGCRYGESDLSQASEGTYEVFRNQRFELHYISLPVMTHLYFAPGFALNFGVQPAFLADNRQRADLSTVEIGKDGSYTYSTETEKMNIKNGFTNGFDLAIPFGISYEKENVVIDARCLLGVTKLYKSVLDNKQRNRAIVLSAGYKFDIGRL